MPVRETTLAKIETLLEAANGKRRQRLVTLAEVLGLAKDVAEGHPWSYLDGGRVANAYQQAASTTFALVARVDGAIFLGISTANANGTPTPGRAWKSLQPFGEAGPKGDAAAKWAAWTTSPDVIRLDAPEVDSLIETGAI